MTNSIQTSISKVCPAYSKLYLLDMWISLLQGGGACHDIAECTRRCEEDGVPLCSSKNARDQIQMGGRASVWSPLPEENPAFHDWYKVISTTRCFRTSFSK